MSFTYALHLLESSPSTASESSNSNYASLPVLAVQQVNFDTTNGQPWGGTAAEIPGLIEAEQFDTGGEGVGYHDTTAKNVRNVRPHGWFACRRGGAKWHAFSLHNNDARPTAMEFRAQPSYCTVLWVIPSTNIGVGVFRVCLRFV